MLISVIIPVYNAEAYINACMNSLLRQQFEDMEILLVEDGSQDDSAAICDDWAQKEHRVRVIHKENGGPASARNAGIKAAEGLYIMFLDCDDTFKKGSLKTVVAILCANQPDVVIGHYCVRDVEKNIIIMDKDSELTETAQVETLLNEIGKKRLAPCVWRYAVRRDFILQNHLFFEDKLMVAEDVLWTVKMLCSIRSFQINEEVFYQYNLHPSSITATLDFTKMKDIMEVCCRLYDFGRDRAAAKKNLGYSYICIITNNMLQYYHALNKTEKSYVRKWIKEQGEMYDLSLNAMPVLKAGSRILGNFYSMKLAAELVRWKLSMK